MSDEPGIMFPTSVLDRLRGQAPAFAVYLYLCERANGLGAWQPIRRTALPPEDEIARAEGLSIEQVQSAMTVLHKAGLIEAQS